MLLDIILNVYAYRYPDSYTAFQKAGLSGSWDHTKAGTRMKLPIPITWETQISAYGNKHSVWESLIGKEFVLCKFLWF